MMTARLSIEPERIIEATIELIRAGGWDAVSARNLADRIGCSTMPIYSSIGSMETLRELAADQAESLLFKEQRKKRTDNEALDMAIGYVDFARKEPRLFRFVIAERARAHQLERENRSGVHGPPGTARASGLKQDGVRSVSTVRSMLESIDGASDQDDFLLRSWAFTHGIAELISSGVITLDEREIIRHLSAAGGALYSLENQAISGGREK